MCDSGVTLVLFSTVWTSTTGNSIHSRSLNPLFRRRCNLNLHIVLHIGYRHLGATLIPILEDSFRVEGRLLVMASEQAQQKAAQFFHHDKPESETPSIDSEFGKKAAKDSGARQAEHKEQRAAEAAQKTPHTERDVERSVKESLRQADQYGREMNIGQTLPQTLIEEQNPFGGSMNEKGKSGMHDKK